jgi:uncharacterized protein YaiE (UPF0345 family)
MRKEKRMNARVKLCLLSLVVLFGVMANNVFAVENAAPTLQFGPDEIVKIMAVNGDVQVKIDPSTEWTPAQPGQALKLKDSIKTTGDG